MWIHKIEVKTYKIIAECNLIKGCKGEMKPVVNASVSSLRFIPERQHQCTECGRKEILDTYYPKIIYENRKT